MKAAFVLVKCELGRVTEVARAIMEIDGVSEVHSITGDHDLLVKLYADDYEAFGDLIPNQLQRVPGLRAVAAHQKQLLRNKLIEHKLYIAEHGDDMPDIRDWRWPE